jgi:hypothetical protein
MTRMTVARSASERIVQATTAILYGALVTAPYGAITFGWTAIDYWLNRYQTLAGAAVAFVTIIYLSKQVRLQQRQHQVEVRMRNRPERDALERALFYALSSERLIIVDNDGVELGWQSPIFPSEPERSQMELHMPHKIHANFSKLLAALRRHKALVVQLNDDTVDELKGKLRKSAQFVEVQRNLLLLSIERRREVLDQDELL